MARFLTPLPWLSVIKLQIKCNLTNSSQTHPTTSYSSSSSSSSSSWPSCWYLFPPSLCCDAIFASTAFVHPIALKFIFRCFGPLFGHAFVWASKLRHGPVSGSRRVWLAGPCPVGSKRKHLSAVWAAWQEYYFHVFDPCLHITFES